MSKIYWIAGGVAAAVLLTLLALALGEFIGRKDGAAAVQVQQLGAQIKTDAQVNHNYSKVDNATPFTGPSDARLKWLRANASSHH